MKEKIILIGKTPSPREILSPLNEDDARVLPDWRSAEPGKIQLNLQKVLQKPSGGWFALGAPDGLCVKRNPEVRFIDGKEILLLRENNRFHCLSNPCPHMGAPLSIGRFEKTRVTCAWHGLALDCGSPHSQNHLPLYHDGYLLWVRLPVPGEEPSPSPFLCERPRDGLAAVYQKTLRCEPHHVIQNRLDPWHGAHFHPHTFARLFVYRETEEALFLRVAFRVWNRFCVEVEAKFDCPEPRTIVMTIVEGEGKGSVVETHATPIGPGYTLLTELTIAHSDRAGFKRVSKLFRGLITHYMVRSMAKLWREDGAYAERRYWLERGAQYPMVAERGANMTVGEPS